MPVWLLILWLCVILHTLITLTRAFWHGRHVPHEKRRQVQSSCEPFVSILIPAWCERSVLKDTTDALLRSTYSGREIIVIAGGEDGTEEVARSLGAGQPNWKVVQQPPKGKNAALNLGLAQSKGEIIVVLDADTKVDSHWLANLVAVFTDDVDVSIGNYFPAKRTWVSGYFEMEKISSYQVHRDISLRGCGFAIKRQVLEQIGRFPEEVTVGVDWDLHQRLRRLGRRQVFVEDARSITILPQTVSQFWRNEVRWRTAHLRTAFRYHDLRSLPFYIVGLAFFIIPFAALWINQLAGGGWQIWPLFWIWVLLRRLSLPLEVAAFSGVEWIEEAWVPLVLLPIDFAAGLLAMTRVSRKIIHFKGFRPE